MAFDINAFRSKLEGGGARSNLFQVRLVAPAAVGLNVEEFSFMCTSAALPASSVAPIDQFYFGRSIKLAGERTFQDWNTSVLNDEAFDIRDAMERWSGLMASYTTLTQTQRQGISSNPYEYVGAATIQQYGKDGSVIKTVNLVNCWPSEVSDIQLSWEDQGQVERFDVTWSYDYFTSDSAI